MYSLIIRYQNRVTDDNEEQKTGVIKVVSSVSASGFVFSGW